MDECRVMTDSIADHIDYGKKLPESEYEVMNAIWSGISPMNTAYLMEAVGKKHSWKAPTLISFLVRLEERGYISSEKRGKERYYFPVADKSIYLRSISDDFLKRYHDGSFVKFMDSLYSEKLLTESDIDSLLEWLKTKY